ncbi:MAG: zinc ribbon domain-containing protein [Lachnospira sp.]
MTDNYNQMPPTGYQQVFNYKGLIFPTAEDMNAMIAKDNEANQFCINIEQYSHRTLFEKRAELMTFPPTIFGPYIAKINTFINIKENQEKNNYIQRIELSELEALGEVQNNIASENYSTQTKNELFNALNYRKIVCQKMILDTEIMGYESMDRAGISALMQNITAKNFEQVVKDEYIAKLSMQYDNIEKNELAALCADLENLEIDQLVQLENHIREQNYQMKFAEGYFGMIKSRINFIHVRDLEQICKNVSEADREELAAIKSNVDAKECETFLKQRFYDLIKERTDALDYNDLCMLTEGFESKSVEELEVLYKELSTGNYNPKFIKSFLFNVRIALEKGQLDYVKNQLKDIDSMDKTQILNVSDSIAMKDYPDRVTANAKRKLEVRNYNLDMLELIGLCNDFDSLSKDDIVQLKNQINQKNVCDSSKNKYLAKVTEREKMIGYETLSPYVTLFKQICDAQMLSDQNIKLALYSQNYESLLDGFFKQFGENNLYELPIFIWPELSYTAMSVQKFYCKSSTGLMYLNMSDIRGFSCESKFLSDIISVVLTNGTVITIDGSMSKKLSKVVVGVLNTYLQNYNNPNVICNYNTTRFNVAKFDENEYRVTDVEIDLSKYQVEKKFLESYCSIAATARITSVKMAMQGNWQSVAQKAFSGFGIINPDQLLWLFDKSMFGSAKEGFAVGENALYIKKGSNPVIVLPVKQVYSVDAALNSLCITLSDNNVYIAELAMNNDTVLNEIAKILDEYVKCMQLTKYEMPAPVQPVPQPVPAPAPVQPVSQPVPAPAPVQPVSQPVPTPAPVQPQDEILFCPECGTKLKEGALFCVNCGFKVR